MVLVAGRRWAQMLKAQNSNKSPIWKQLFIFPPMPLFWSAAVMQYYLAVICFSAKVWLPSTDFFGRSLLYLVHIYVPLGIIIVFMHILTLWLKYSFLLYQIINYLSVKGKITYPFLHMYRKGIVKIWHWIKHVLITYSHQIYHNHLLFNHHLFISFLPVNSSLLYNLSLQQKLQKISTAKLNKLYFPPKITLHNYNYL